MKYRPLNLSAAQRGEMKRLLQALRSLTLCPAAEPHHVTQVVKLYLWLQAPRCPSVTSAWTFRSLRHHSCSVSRERVLFCTPPPKLHLHLHPNSLIQQGRWFLFPALKIHFAQRSPFVITQVFLSFDLFPLYFPLSDPNDQSTGNHSGSIMLISQESL